MTSAIVKLRPCSPMDKSSHPRGLIMPNIKIVGASRRKMFAASVHFGSKDN